MGEEIKTIQTIYAELNEQQRDHLRDVSRVTSIEIALDEFEAFLKGLPEDSRERKMQADQGEQGFKPSYDEERKLYWIGKIRKGIKAASVPIHYIERLKAEPQQVLIEAFENRVDTLKKTALEARKRTELGLYLDGRQARAAALFPAECEMLQWLKGRQADQHKQIAPPPEDQATKQYDIPGGSLGARNQGANELPAETQAARSVQIHNNGMVMGKMSEDVFLIIEAIREAGRSYIKHAPKDEEQQHQQERKLQDNQNMIWYDPDFTEPLKRFVYSLETFGKWFKLLESDEVQPELCLHDVRLTIDQQGIKREVLYALGCWEDEFIEDRHQKGKPEYSPAYVREQQEKFAIQKETGIPVDSEGLAYQRYVALLQARRWLNKAVKPSISIWQLRSMMQTIHGISCSFQGSWNTIFTINTEGKVPLLDIAGEWIDAIEDENRENFLNRRSSNIVLHAEKDVVAWISDRQRSLNRYDPAKLSKECLSLLAKVIIEELIMTRYDRLNEKDKAIALSAPGSNMLFRSRKRIIAMYEGMLKPDGFRLTGPDVEVLQEAISLEIDAARKQLQQPVAPAGDQDAKQHKIPGSFIDVSDHKNSDLPAESQSAISGQMHKNRQKLGINYDLRQAAKIISVYDIVWAFKRAVLDYIDYIEAENAEREQAKEEAKLEDKWRVLILDTRFSKALQPLVSSLEWAYYKPNKASSENQLEKILSQIIEKGYDLRFAIQVALMHWRSEFIKDRSESELPKYTIDYIREQQAKCELEYDLGVDIDREGLQFVYFLANIHALRWLFRVSKLNQSGTPPEVHEPKTPQTPKKDGRIKVEDREAYKRKMFPQMIELISNGETKCGASALVAAPFGIKPNTVEIKFNKFMKSKKEAINLLKEIGRDDLIEKLNELSA
ncbi:MAG: hypothetical protein FDX18_11435 [Chlorobium sp.]|nr:MAG: hypothetical protein FDX18_11435 [Chlorobium sp.]